MRDNVLTSALRVRQTGVLKVVLGLVFLFALSGCSDGVNTTPVATGQSAETARTFSAHNDSFAGQYYSGSAVCADCHNGIVDTQGNDISIGTDWSTSMMANSARDPYWLAKFAVEVHRNPSLTSGLQDTCTRCHVPMANDTALKDNVAIDLLSADGVLNAANPLFDHAMDGVSCTLCHQAEDDGLLGTVEGTSGNYVVAIQDQLSNRPAYGPYVDPAAVRMQAQSLFVPRFSEHIATSESCAACHDLRTPQFDSSTPSARDFFPEQMVYSEWKNSAFAQDINNQQTCQSCHMPEVAGEVPLASVGGGTDRSGFSRHTFLGPNTVMQSILMNNAEALGIDVPPAEFEKAIVRNRQFIGGAASLQIQSAVRQGGDLIAQLDVRNLAGHKLPSGFASRRAFVHFVLSDTSGNILFESGLEQADGSVSGINTDSNSTRFEPHFDLITSEDQVQVYEAIMGDEAVNVTHTLMNATSYLKDNRLLPAGFDKVSAADDIQTHGQAASDTNFDGGGDQLTYQISVPDGVELVVSATLVYQPLAFGHIQDLFRESQLADVAFFQSMFTNATLKSEVIAADSVRVPAAP